MSRCFVAEREGEMMMLLPVCEDDDCETSAIWACDAKHCNGDDDVMTIRNVWFLIKILYEIALVTISAPRFTNS